MSIQQYHCPSNSATVLQSTKHYHPQAASEVTKGGLISIRGGLNQGRQGWRHQTAGAAGVEASDSRGSRGHSRGEPGIIPVNQVHPQYPTGIWILDNQGPTPTDAGASAVLPNIHYRLKHNTPNTTYIGIQNRPLLQIYTK